MAHKLAQLLDCEVREVVPAVDGIGFLFLLSFLRIGIRTNISAGDLQGAQEVVVLGPVWGGLLVSPLRSVLAQCNKASKRVHVAVTCETREEDKDGGYGFEQALRGARKVCGDLLGATAGFSTVLVTDYVDGAATTETSGKTRITEANYGDALKGRLRDFADRIREGGD